MFGFMLYACLSYDRNTAEYTLSLYNKLLKIVANSGGNLVANIDFTASINHLTPRRTQVSPFTEISILF